MMARLRISLRRVPVGAADEWTMGAVDMGWGTGWSEPAEGREDERPGNARYYSGTADDCIEPVDQSPEVFPLFLHNCRGS